MCSFHLNLKMGKNSNSRPAPPTHAIQQQGWPWLPEHWIVRLILLCIAKRTTHFHPSIPAAGPEFGKKWKKANIRGSVIHNGVEWKHYKCFLLTCIHVNRIHQTFVLPYRILHKLFKTIHSPAFKTVSLKKDNDNIWIFIKEDKLTYYLITWLQGFKEHRYIGACGYTIAVNVR